MPMLPLSCLSVISTGAAPYDIIHRTHLAVLKAVVSQSKTRCHQGSVRGLASEVAAGKFIFEAGDEDVHSALERG